MKRTTVVLIAAILLLTIALVAAQPKTYQVTGIVKSVTADMITVDKSGEMFQIAKNAGTKVTGDLKAGVKVTVEYRMTAASVEVKK
ncbi:MAG: hypothetical protein QOK37_3117 [Thermoanaerobaculia bacterium]|jgi:hypothetical protein|nr:hypothetical protein [Thermoanaerobaculia bacterium]